MVVLGGQELIKIGLHLRKKLATGKRKGETVAAAAAVVVVVVGGGGRVVVVGDKFQIDGVVEGPIDAALVVAVGSCVVA